MKLRLLALCVASGLVLSGCVSGTPDPVPSPSPTPSPVCTPEAGGDKYPCSQEEYEAMKAKDALYAEAEEVNREFRVIIDRFYREGAPAEMPADLVAITDGSARQDLEKAIADMHRDKITMSGGDVRQVYVRRNLASKEGSDVSLSVCDDGSHLTVNIDGKPSGSGNAIVHDFYYKQVDGVMKVWAVDGEVVESCE